MTGYEAGVWHQQDFILLEDGGYLLYEDTARMMLDIKPGDPWSRSTIGFSLPALPQNYYYVVDSAGNYVTVDGAYVYAWALA
jgi:hypothetical protein